jgi:hypothetical protein
MPTQKRETGTNYVGLLRDEIDVLGLMAAMFSRRSEAR